MQHHHYSHGHIYFLFYLHKKALPRSGSTETSLAISLDPISREMFRGGAGEGEKAGLLTNGLDNHRFMP
jgi:hypothetical protein